MAFITRRTTWMAAAVAVLVCGAAITVGGQETANGGAAVATNGDTAASTSPEGEASMGNGPIQDWISRRQDERSDRLMNSMMGVVAPLVSNADPDTLVSLMSRMPEGVFDSAVSSMDTEQMTTMMNALPPETLAAMIPVLMETASPETISTAMDTMDPSEMASMIPELLEATPPDQIGPLMNDMVKVMPVETMTKMISSMSDEDLGNMVSSLLSADIPQDALVETMAAFMTNPDVFGSISRDKMKAVVDAIPPEQYAEIFPLMINSMSDEQRDQMMSTDPESLKDLAELFTERMPPDILLDTFNAIPPDTAPFFLQGFVDAMDPVQLKNLIKKFVLESDVDVVIETLENVRAETPDLLNRLLENVSASDAQTGIARGNPEQQERLKSLLGDTILNDAVQNTNATTAA